MNSEWSTDVRFDTHSGLKSDIARGLKRARSGHDTPAVINAVA
jgi:hypothetical protein